jgi:hypothetical protein
MENLSMTKKIFFVILSAICVIQSGCSDDGDSSDQTKLSGTWELSTIYSGFGESRFQVGNGTRYEFEKDHFKKFTDFKLVDEGSFAIVRQLNPMKGVEGNRLIFNNETDTLQQFVEISHGTLTLTWLGYDTSTVVYTRYYGNTRKVAP